MRARWLSPVAALLLGAWAPGFAQVDVPDDATGAAETPPPGGSSPDRESEPENPEPPVPEGATAESGQTEEMGEGETGEPDAAEEETMEADAEVVPEEPALPDEPGMVDDALIAPDDGGAGLEMDESLLLQEFGAFDLAPDPEAPTASAAAGTPVDGESAAADEAVPAEPDSPFDLGGHVGLEYRQYFKSPQDPRQPDFNFSLVINPEFSYEWEGERRTVLNFSPFYRLDQEDDERSHFDVRELNVLTVGDRWDLRVGAAKVFWGATEAVHWVDVINQTDLVENLDGEDKLGQPMVNLNLQTDWGNISLFALPYFRERTFTGAAGRPRTIPRIDGDRAVYESAAREWHQDFAARWSKSIGGVDVGLSYFHGTSREPSYLLGLDRGETVLLPYYELIHQGALDVQWTFSDWLLKLETVYRSGQGDEGFFLIAGGFEYTFHGILGTQADLGVISEMLYDTRGNNPLNPYENDIVVGLRLAANDLRDTTLLASAITDLHDGSTVLSLEGSRRMGEHWKLVMEARGFAGIPADDFPLNGFRNDHYVQIGLERHF